MKSYKQRTLDAQADLIRRYMENDPPERCPFCEIYALHQVNCLGCFMAGIFWGAGCCSFSSSILSVRMGDFEPKQRLRRAEFHRKVRKILLKRPAKYFTPKGWKYLDIPREW